MSGWDVVCRVLGLSFCWDSFVSILLLGEQEFVPTDVPVGRTGQVKVRDKKEGHGPSPQNHISSPHTRWWYTKRHHLLKMINVHNRLSNVYNLSRLSPSLSIHLDRSWKTLPTIGKVSRSHSDLGSHFQVLPHAGRSPGWFGLSVVFCSKNSCSKRSAIRVKDVGSSAIESSWRTTGHGIQPYKCRSPAHTLILQSCFLSLKK